MTTLKLYELAEQHRQLEILTDSGDVPDEVIRDILDTFETDVAEKVRAVTHMVRHLEALAAGMTAEAKRMQERASRTAKRADSLRAYLIFNMIAMDRLKMDYPEFTVAVKDNPVSVIIDPTAIVPDEFMVTPEPQPSPDKKALKEALLAGREVEGVKLQRGQRLDVR